MTLKIHNIMYDHTQEFRTYPAGVLTIDTTTRAIHVHDGLTPNGWVMPTTANLDNYALKDLTNVTQESMNNALNTFGAMNLNKSDPLGTTQKDNFWNQVGGTALKSDAEVPKKNYLYVDGKTKTIQAGDLATLIGFGMDFSKKKDRQATTTYTADEDGYIVLQLWYSRDGHGSTSTGLFIDDVMIFDNEKNSWNKDYARNTNFSVPAGCFPVCAGQKYRYTAGGGISLRRFFWCPLKYKLASSTASS